MGSPPAEQGVCYVPRAELCKDCAALHSLVPKMHVSTPAPPEAPPVDPAAPQPPSPPPAVPEPPLLTPPEPIVHKPGTFMGQLNAIQAKAALVGGLPDQSFQAPTPVTGASSGLCNASEESGTAEPVPKRARLGLGMLGLPKPTK